MEKKLFQTLLLIAFFIVLFCNIHPLSAQSDDNSDKFGINLTDKEKLWLKKHPVINFTGDPNWLPQEAFTKDGGYIGIIADYLKLIEKKIPITFNIIPVKNWTQSLNYAKERKVDVLSAGMTKEREQYLSFTESFDELPIVFLTRKNTPPLKSSNDLNGKEVILINNYSYIPKIRKDYTGIKPIFMPNLKEGLLALSKGKYDAIVVTESTALYLLNELNITNLKIALKTPLNINLALGVRKDWPELVSILNKALGSITAIEAQQITHKWYFLKTEKMNDEKILKKDLYSVIKIVIAGVFALFIIMMLILKFLGDKISFSIQEKTVKIIVIIGLVIFLTSVISGSYVSLSEMKNRTLHRTTEMLDKMTSLTENSLEIWFSGKRKVIKIYASDEEFTHAAEQLLSKKQTRSTLLNNKTVNELRGIFCRFQKTCLGFDIISPDFINYASSENNHLGRKNLIAYSYPDLLK